MRPVGICIYNNRRNVILQMPGVIAPKWYAVLINCKSGSIPMAR